jgi:hypothetical protein
MIQRTVNELMKFLSLVRLEVLCGMVSLLFRQKKIRLPISFLLNGTIVEEAVTTALTFIGGGYLSFRRTHCARRGALQYVRV